MLLKELKYKDIDKMIKLVRKQSLINKEKIEDSYYDSFNKEISNYPIGIYRLHSGK